MSSEYDDIIDLPHYEPVGHKRMATSDRAVQFAPFAALSGHGEAIAETGRTTSSRPMLTDEECAELSRRLRAALAVTGERPRLRFIIFIPDNVKEGGRLSICCGSIRRIDEYNRILQLTDGRLLPLDDIVSIGGDIFE